MKKKLMQFARKTLIIEYREYNSTEYGCNKLAYNTSKTSIREAIEQFISDVVSSDNPQFISNFEITSAHLIERVDFEYFDFE